MLYNEFLEGTGAVDNEASYAEYKRVELIYMESDHCTKQDAYRMAQVETVKQYEKRMKKARQEEKAWVLDNIIGACAFIRGMSEKENYTRRDFSYVSPCGNVFVLKLENVVNGGSVRQYSLHINDEKVDLRRRYSFGLIDSAEIQSYRADWHDKSRKELEDLFGYIA